MRAQDPPDAEGVAQDSPGQSDTDPTETTIEVNLGWLVLAVLAVAVVAGGVWFWREAPGAMGSSDTVATVNGEAITSRDVEVELLIQTALQAQMGNQLTTNEEDLQSFRRDLLDQLVDQTLVKQAAEAEGLVPTREEAQGEVAQAAPGLSVETLLADIRAAGVTDEEWGAWAQRQIAGKRFFETQTAAELAAEHRERRGQQAGIGLDPSDVAAALQRDADITFNFGGFEGTEGEDVPMAREGELAPDFTLQSLDGTTIRLSDFRGQPVMLNFWATWCGPCRVEMPLFIQTYEAHKDAGLTVLAVDVQESPEQVRPFVDEFGLTFPVALDRDGQVATLYRVRGLPTTMFIDENGVLETAHRGAILKQAQLIDLLEGILPSVRN